MRQALPCAAGAPPGIAGLLGWLKGNAGGRRGAVLPIGTGLGTASDRNRAGPAAAAP